MTPVKRWRHYCKFIKPLPEPGLGIGASPTLFESVADMRRITAAR